ncbi:MAG: DUF1634 domain-containing protein [Acidobacteriota bacterium]|nr:DUF1634 domain-containing protein [Acidobacteriota bacterium]
MERLLRVATWLAAGMLGLGLVLWLAGVPHAATLMHAGLWLLIATPITRAIMALVEYVTTRDWTFVLLTAVVLACLVFPALRFLSSLR